MQCDVPACPGLAPFWSTGSCSQCVLPSTMCSYRLECMVYTYVQCTLMTLPVFIILCTSIKIVSMK